tara:strand:+ start:3813 stop:4157 length:345 start_codon:yes stop_codon:yes gene_type:complete
MPVKPKKSERDSNLTKFLNQLTYLDSKTSSNSIQALALLSRVMLLDPNPVYMSELAKYNETGAMRTSKLVKILVKDGLLQITKCPEDSRKREITLTNKGRGLSYNFNPAFWEHE